MEKFFLRCCSCAFHKVACPYLFQMSHLFSYVLSLERAHICIFFSLGLFSPFLSLFIYLFVFAYDICSLGYLLVSFFLSFECVMLSLHKILCFLLMLVCACVYWILFDCLFACLICGQANKVMRTNHKYSMCFSLSCGSLFKF